VEIFKPQKEVFSLRVNLEWMAMPPFSDFKTWKSLNGKYRVTIIKRGGESYEGIRIKQIALEKKSKISPGWQEIMEATEIITKENQIRKWISLSVRDDCVGNHITPIAEYFDIDGIGRLLPYTSFSSPLKNEKYNEIPDDKFYSWYRSEQAENGIREGSELPPHIDTEKTIKKFVGQINRRDFSQPVLVPRKVTQEEIMLFI